MSVAIKHSLLVSLWVTIDLSLTHLTYSSLSLFPSVSNLNFVLFFKSITMVAVAIVTVGNRHRRVACSCHR